jgi:acyl transferase domain-containing protein/acyl carrier protein/protein-L-isoaspartate O-methyltransferase
MSDVSRRLADLSPEKRALLAKHLGATAADRGVPGSEAVAIIGLGCRFPGRSNSPEAFWELLHAGVDAIGPIPVDRWDSEAYYDPDPAVPGKMNTRWGAFLEGVDQFDAEFFGISPREASALDPQQRLLLEVAWETLEDAGQMHAGLAGSATGVFVGVHSHSVDYLQLMRANGLAPLDGYTCTGTAHSILANRLSFLLDLHGPSLAIDTACSSSLVATHLACQSIRAGESDLALACGLNLILSPETSLALAKLEMLAPDGRCKTFDANANGFVRGEGCGVVLLKRLNDALRDRDRIVAVIRGSAVNQDGATNGLTAPNGRSQTRAIRRALMCAGLEPSRVSLVETHGTGTALGDPIEVEALASVYGRSTEPARPCHLGAVKTNIGHLEGAAGIAGLIKAALSLEHRVIPPNLHFTALNPHISLDGTRFEIPTRPQPWSAGDGQSRCAAVSSFGFGGTNAHLILEEAPARSPALRPQSFAPETHVLPLSARSIEALRALAGSYATFLADPLRGAGLSVGDIAYTASVRRLHHRHRLAVIGRSHHEWIEQLVQFVERGRSRLTDPEASANAKGRSQVDFDRDERSTMVEAHAKRYAEGLDVDWGTLHRTGGECVLLPRYPWQRKRYWITSLQRRVLEIDGHGAELARGDWFYEIDWQLKSHLETPRPREAPDYFPEPAALAVRMASRVLELSFQNGLDDLDGLLPKLEALALDYLVLGLARIGIPFGTGERWSIEGLAARRHIQPHHTRLLARFHEILEPAGFIEQDGLAWQSSCPPGLQDPDRLYRQLRDEYPAAQQVLDLVKQCGSQLAEVLAGGLDPLQLLFSEDGEASAERIYADPPFAKVGNALVADTIDAALAGLPANRTLRVLEIGAGTGGTTARVLPRLPGRRTEYIFTDVSKLLLRKAAQKFGDFPFVRFECLDIEQDPEAQGFGPSQFDVIIAANALHATQDLRQSLAHVRALLSPGGMVVLLEGTGSRLWVDLTFGLTEGWWRFADSRTRQSGPLVSAEGWKELLAAAGFPLAACIPCQARTETALVEQAILVARRPSVDANSRVGTEARRIPFIPRSARGESRWLIFADSRAVGPALAEHLRTVGETFVLVSPGERFEVIDSARFRIRPDCPDDYDMLLATVLGSGLPIHAAIHLWSLDAETPHDATPQAWEAPLVGTCGSTMLLVQALLRAGHVPVRGLWLVTRGAQPAAAEDGPLGLAQVPLWGLGRALALEHPELWGGLIDLDARGDESEAWELLRQVNLVEPEDQIALRRGDRYVARLVRRPAPGSKTLRIRGDGAYLITGGLGRLGLLVAGWLAQQGARHLVLLGRRGLTADLSHNTIQPDEARDARVAAIRAIEGLGATVEIVAADVGDDALMDSVLSRFGATAPQLRGVVHAAGAFAFRPLHQVVLADLRAEYRCKVMGSWVLHRGTIEHDLDFFVLFSSGASVWGVKGLAPYGAANQFLDGLAHYRRSLGLPAISINWGLWAGSSSSEANRSAALGGVKGMESEPALRAFGELLNGGPPQVVVAAIDWDRFKPLYSFKRIRLFLARILESVDKRHAVPITSFNSLADRLRSVQPREARELLFVQVREEIARILGIDPESFVESAEGFFQMGMDSISSVQLSRSLGTKLGCKLPPTIALEYPRIKALCRHLEQNVLGMTGPGMTDESARAAPPVSHEDGSISDQLDQYSEEELAMRLDREIDRLTGAKDRGTL